MIGNGPFEGLQLGHYAAILADPPWKFETWGKQGEDSREPDYATMSIAQISALPVEALAAHDCVLFMWVSWPTMPRALDVIDIWGFTYKTCAFAWMKAKIAGQLDMFDDGVRVMMGTGYWTRSNSEVCLLATRGHPKRVNADVRQGIIEPRRQHSRKPDCVYERIERLVHGPYVELFARQQRDGWDAWGNEVDKFSERRATA
jgi:N6-adenosine-specific RNA methylase IME4